MSNLVVNCFGGYIKKKVNKKKTLEHQTMKNLFAKFPPITRFSKK